MSAVAWELVHSVETNASAAFAWSYWTNVENWDDPPAIFAFDGPFIAGARGRTLLPGQAPLHWVVREVSPRHTATIEMQLEGATLSFAWRFEGLPDGRTRLTQRMVLAGENADSYLSQVKTAFEVSLAEGMKKLSMAMATAKASGKGQMGRGQNADQRSKIKNANVGHPQDQL